jgi:hypothetical protein
MAHNSVTDPQGFPQNALTPGAGIGVKTSLFGWPNFTGFALIENILRKISTTYESSTDPTH